jgi:hypothetical protein
MNGILKQRMLTAAVAVESDEHAPSLECLPEQRWHYNASVSAGYKRGPLASGSWQVTTQNAVKRPAVGLRENEWATEGSTTYKVLWA